MKVRVSAVHNGSFILATNEFEDLELRDNRLTLHVPASNLTGSAADYIAVNVDIMGIDTLASLSERVRQVEIELARLSISSL